MIKTLENQKKLDVKVTEGINEDADLGQERKSRLERKYIVGIGMIFWLTLLGLTIKLCSKGWRFEERRCIEEDRCVYLDLTPTRLRLLYHDGEVEFDEQGRF